MPASRARPVNVLLVHADQHRFDCVGVNGHPLVRTPNLDRLAREGVNCTHAFTPNPVCSPARASLQTGAWATTHRCVTIHGTEAFQPADPGLPVLTQLVADAGYRVGHVGKFHAEVAGGPTDHGAEAYVSGDGYAAWREAQGIPPRPRVNGFYGEIDPHVTPGQTSLAWQADRVLEMLDAYSAGGQRFLIRWDPPEPHLPNIVPRELADLYPPGSIAPWPSFPDPLEGKPHVQHRTRTRWGTDGWGWDRWAPVVGRYLADITLLDRQVGRILHELDRRGLTDSTLVVYTADHGDMAGGHGMMDKHYVMYDDVVRVPLMLRLPGVLPAGETHDGFVVHELDLARTILRAAGVDAPDSFVGRDLIADLAPGGETGGTPPRSDVFSQYQGTHQGLYSQRMLRDRRWKYVYNPVAFDELYDLDADPGELRNLAAPGSPDEGAHAGTLHRLRRRTGEWMAAVGDPLSPPLHSWRPR